MRAQKNLSEKAQIGYIMSSGQEMQKKINTFFIYGIIVILVIVFVLSFFPAYNIKIETSQLVIVLIVVVLLLFRYFNIIEIPGFLKLSKQIEEIKSETKEIRQAQMTLMQAFTISQSATASSEVHIHPVIDQAVIDAEEEAETLLSEPPSISVDLTSFERNRIRSEETRIRQLVQNREYIPAFALLRNYIDSLLKDILGIGPDEIRNFHQLLRDVRKRELLTPQLLESMLSVRRFANMVIHMSPSAERELPIAKVDKIIDLGIRTIRELESIRRSHARDGIQSSR